MKHWEILNDKKNKYLIELKDPEGWRSAAVKWDGCIHYYRYFNNPLDDENRDDEDTDYIHICDIDDEIERLTQLRDIAKEHFGNDWNR